MNAEHLADRGAAAQGFTFVEVVLSLTLFATLLVAVISVFSVGQQSYLTSIGVQQAQLSTSRVLEMMRDDLMGARIEGYANEFSGNGKVFIKFRRLAPQTTNSNSGTAPIWQSQVFMYVWCFQNGANPCNTIGPPPENDQLLLVRAAPSNPNGNLSGAWEQVSILIGHMDTTLGDPVKNAPETYPFQVTIMNNASVPGNLCRSTLPPDNNYCGGHACLGATTECRYPFSLLGTTPSPGEPDRVAGSISLRLLTVGAIRGMGGSRLHRENRALSFRLRNAQKGCLAPADGSVVPPCNF